MTQNGPKMTQNGSKLPKNDISEMLRFTRFARHKFSAARHLKLFCTPVYALVHQVVLVDEHPLHMQPHPWVVRPHLHHWNNPKVLFGFFFFAKKNIFDWWNWAQSLGFGHFQRFLNFFFEWQKLLFI